MATNGSDLPAAPPPAPHTWRSGVVCLGLFCLVAGLFLAAGFKESLLPRAMAIAGIVFLIVGGFASAIESRRSASRGK